MDAAEAANHIARAVEEAMGVTPEPMPGLETPRGPWLPLSVRYGAAEAAARVVIAWREKAVTPVGGPYDTRRGYKTLEEELLNPSRLDGVFDPTLGQATTESEGSA